MRVDRTPGGNRAGLLFHSEWKKSTNHQRDDHPLYTDDQHVRSSCDRLANTRANLLWTVAADSAAGTGWRRGSDGWKAGAKSLWIAGDLRSECVLSADARLREHHESSLAAERDHPSEFVHVHHRGRGFKRSGFEQCQLDQHRPYCQPDGDGASQAVN